MAERHARQQYHPSRDGNMMTPLKVLSHSCAPRGVTVAAGLARIQVADTELTSGFHPNSSLCPQSSPLLLGVQLRYFDYLHTNVLSLERRRPQRLLKP
jgi:hypothetical protein